MTGDELEDQREVLLDGWDDAAKAWGRQADRIQAAALPVSRWMLEHAGLTPGQRVLELAAGPGDTGFMAAREIQPGGTLICSDAVAGMLDVARDRAVEQGIANVEFKQLQLEWIDLPTADVDVALCRWGVMLTVDPTAALRECRRVLRPGGRLALAVWDIPAENPWATIVHQALIDLGHVEPDEPGGPGMFALSTPGHLGQLLVDAGFFDVVVEPVPILRRYDNVLDWIGETRDLSRQFGAVWGGLGDEQRQELRERLASTAAGFTNDDGTVELPGGCLAAAASA